MFTPKPKTALKLFALFLLISVVINSCKKEGNNTQKNITNATILQAKQWYESTYPINTATKSKFSTFDVGTVSNSPIDLSQYALPDWVDATNYTRDGENVIEIPIDSGALLGFDFKNTAINKIYSNKKYTRSNFLLLNDGDTYSAYIMMIMADSSYVQNDLSKLANNTYVKHDADFSGMVLYFTPKGDYVSGNAYQRGQLVIESSSDTSLANQTSFTNKKVLKPSSATLVLTCTDWYLDTYVNNMLIGSAYVGTTCSAASNAQTSSPIPPPPPKCIVSTGTTTVQSNRHLIVNQAAPLPGSGGSGGSGGFPPPVQCTTITNQFPDFDTQDNGNCNNCRVSDNSFDDFLQETSNLGYNYGDPEPGYAEGADGTKYPGEFTYIRDQQNNIVASFFSPDINGGPFVTGTEYKIGNPGSGFSSTASGPSGSSEFSGGTVTYISYPGSTQAPAGGTGGGSTTPLTAIQRQALENADNNRILNIMQQENLQDDIDPFPCHGTKRSGNVAWNGVPEHWLIQFDYMARNPLSGLKEYYVPGSSSTGSGYAGYADIVNTATSEMFEIKPIGPAGQTAGAKEIQTYVDKANSSCPPANGKPWIKGQNYTPRYLLNPKDPTSLLFCQLSSPGVIIYSSVASNTINVPVPSPVLLPENLAQKLENFLKQLAQNPVNMQLQTLVFLRQNPQIVPYLKGVAAAVIICTVMQDIVTDGVSITDNWQAFLIARTLWEASNDIVLYQ